MTVLEEVIMYTFQQCVYYISKVCAPQGGGNNPQGQHEHPQQLLGCTEGIYFFLSFYFLAVASHRGVFLWAEVPHVLVAAQEKY